MITPDKGAHDDASDLLKRELVKAFASGISQRTPEQIRAEFRERSIIVGIERGRADMKAGNTVSHEAAMAEVDALINELCGPQSVGVSATMNQSSSTKGS